MGIQMGYTYAYEPKTRRLPDWCDKEGAEAIARKIKDYWEAQGFPDLQVDVREGGFTPVMRAARFDVRSTMVNGLPPKALAALQKAA